MKRFKVFLTGALVLATVGGALAFKSASYNGGLYCSSAAGAGGSTTACKTVAAGGTNNGTRFAEVQSGGTLQYCASRGAGPSFPGGTCETTQRQVLGDQ